MARILHADDNTHLQSLARTILEKQGHQVTSASDGAEGLKRFNAEPFDVVISDIQMPVMDGLQLLSAIVETRKPTPVIMATAVDSIETAMEALKIGAFDYVQKPFKVPVLLETIARALKWDPTLTNATPTRAGLAAYTALPGIIAASPAMQRSCEMARRVAPLHTAHLIAGEAGTGRHLIARAIHALSARKEGPFIPFPCPSASAAKPDANLWVPGSVDTLPTGALVKASGGTLLLEDVEAMPLPLQDKLLEVLRDGAVQAGGCDLTPLDVRVLATTSTDLQAAADDGRLRPELVRLLTLIPVLTDPLRNRHEDIVPLAWFFLLGDGIGEDDLPPELARDTRAVLEHHSWPGNVSELRAAMQHVVRQGRRDRIERCDLPDDIVNAVEGRDFGGVAPEPTDERGRAFREGLAKQLARKIEAGFGADTVASRPGQPPRLARQRQPTHAMRPGDYVLPEPVSTIVEIGPPAAAAPPTPPPLPPKGPPPPVARRAPTRRDFLTRIRRALAILFERS